ncbi:MAG: helix-turn-helix transcriptional regulator [Clostridiales bacterium]|nr:helix-turn-helix transcriptional regulator [Clostridiales bacterium]
MEINLSETLKTLRRQRGNRQEDVATHLGISVQAVSKWERGEGLPDITLLPALSSYYGVTVDTLLGCDEIRKNEAVKAFDEECRRLLHEGKNEEKLALCRKMEKEYPNDETVLYWLMYSLQNVSRTENCDEIIRIAEKLVNSADSSYQYGAIQSLCFTYNAIGNYEKAVEYARMIPTDEDLLVSVLKGEKLVDHCRNYFWKLCDTFDMKLQYLTQCSEAGYTAEQRHQMRKILYDLYHMVFSDGDFGFWSERIGRLCYAMALSSMDSGSYDRALDELEDMACQFEAYDAYDVIDHTSPLVYGIHSEYAAIGKSGPESVAASYAKLLTNNEKFGPIADDSRFMAVLDRIGRLKK